MLSSVVNRRGALLGGALFAFTACAPIAQQQAASRQSGEGFVSVGDVVLRVNVTDNLPNAFGRADIFGRTRERGYSELRYVGLDSPGRPIFERRDVEITTNETVFSRGPAFSSYQTQASGSVFGTRNMATGSYGSTASGFATRPTPFQQNAAGSANQIVLDLAQGRIVTLRDRRIQVLEATGAGVRFLVE